MKLLVVCVVAILAAMTALPSATARIRFRLPINRGPTPSTPISCTSVLVKLNPSAYSHCCITGDFKFDMVENSETCPSGRQYVLTREPCPGKPGVKKICDPTIAEKAQSFVRELNLGDNSASESSDLAVSRPEVDLDTATDRGSAAPPDFILSYDSATISRQRRALSVPCPSSQGEKAICQDILSNSCKGKRSAEDFERENTVLADFVQAQEHSYANARTKRSLPGIERNVIFVVDSSGSIGSQNYSRVLNTLAEFSTLFCGDASVGLTTFSQTIDLEFCPTCLRNQDETDYRHQVANKIRSARYHRSLTRTGETVKCLSEVILPSPDCRITTKPTQLVFFTDGKANGCTKVPDALAALTARYPTLETYAIGMGDINESGVTDLLSNTFDPNNVFNLSNIGELEQLLAQIKQLITGGSLACSPVTFG